MWGDSDEEDVEYNAEYNAEKRTLARLGGRAAVSEGPGLGLGPWLLCLLFVLAPFQRACTLCFRVCLLFKDFGGDEKGSVLLICL